MSLFCSFEVVVISRIVKALFGLCQKLMETEKVIGSHIVPCVSECFSIHELEGVR